MGSKTRLGCYCTKWANNGVNLVTSRKINTRLAHPMASSVTWEHRCVDAAYFGQSAQWIIHKPLSVANNSDRTFVCYKVTDHSNSAFEIRQLKTLFFFCLALLLIYQIIPSVNIKRNANFLALLHFFFITTESRESSS